MGEHGKADAEAAALYSVMRNSPTTRYYSAQPVDPSVLRRVLDAARFAPSGGNRQAWEVVIVTDPATRAALADLYRAPWSDYVQQVRADSAVAPRTARVLRAADDFAAALHEVPVHLVVLARLDRLALTDDGLPRPSIVGGASVYPFVQNVLLGCAAEGLGATLTTMLCRNEPAALELLGVPDGFAIAALVAVGHPVPERRPTTMSRATVDTFVHVDRFGKRALERSAP